MPLSKKYLFFVLALAFVLRLSLIFSAYHGDLNNNISWGGIALQRGLNGLYDKIPTCGWPYSQPNQPPLYILMFTALSGIWKVVYALALNLNDSFRFFPSAFIWFWEQRGMTLLVKLPSIFADLCIGWMIYRYIIHKTNKSRLAVLLSAIWLFNPLTWYNSAVWGQTDAIVNLFGLLAVFALLNNNLLRFALFFTLSFLFKASLAVFMPVLGMVAIMQKHKLNSWLKAIIMSLATVITIGIWFHPYSDFPMWFVKLYQDRILPGEIGFLTANAFNFWWLISPGRVLDSTQFLGISARTYGLMIFLMLVILAIYYLRKSLIPKNIFLLLAMSSLISFLFMTRIHPRYLYPFFPYATVTLAFLPTLITSYIILSLTHLANIYYLFWAPSFTSLENLYKNMLFMNIIAVINLLVFVFLFIKLNVLKLKRYNRG